MEIFKMVQQLFEQHGYLVMFLGLFLEFIALPFPGETTMAYAGYLSYTGTLRFDLLLIVAFLGTTTGMTATYWIGQRAGLPFLRRFGRWFFKESKLLKTQSFFDKYGPGLIFFGYFIPGVRHFTGYLAGIMNISFRKFAAYAFSGALFWTLLFLGLGKIFGPQWSVAFKLAEHYAVWIVSALVLLVCVFVIYRYRAWTASIFAAMPGYLKKRKQRKPESSERRERPTRPVRYSVASARERFKRARIVRIRPGRFPAKIVLKSRTKP
ncbi:alkaline phosphatase [Saccharibacillus sp. O23]|uniref:DedA family protein n=1 Tax=Saccharibacillus sp. O23 TaxID=2009338 RepID=UPI000B4E17BD|nr:DedA family protein [Saccharibacillus sp. O23]OWR27670.1 alkaline phosphatase [Saccharibacillus sp. O23]